jgi:hypothetical protein
MHATYPVLTTLNPISVILLGEEEKEWSFLYASIRSMLLALDCWIQTDILSL